LVEYVVRRNVPRTLSYLDRAVIAVLAQVEFKKLGLARMREGGRAGGKGRDERSRPFGDGERWWQAAAKIVGVRPNLVRQLAQIHAKYPDVFEAVRERRIEVMREARELSEGLQEPGARAEALSLREHDRRTRFARIISGVQRSRRPELPASIRAGLRGQSWTLYAGAMDVEARKIGDESIDLVHADIVYGSVPMAVEVARVAARVLVRGGVLALISGNVECLEIQNAVAAEGLTLVTIGSLVMPGSRTARPGRVERIDSTPIYFFGKKCGKGEKLSRPMRHLAYVSGQLEKDAHRWQKNLDATLDLVKSVVDPGARVLDPCCGSGTTGEAALRHACSFIGIDVDKEAIMVASARLCEVERELRQVDGPRPRLLKAGRKGTTRTR
jgi:hypothetical protein